MQPQEKARPTHADDYERLHSGTQTFTTAIIATLRSGNGTYLKSQGVQDKSW